MANGLTGDFDAVVEVRVEAVNRILATLHQNGASKDASPSFLHSFAIRVGEQSVLAPVAISTLGVSVIPYLQLKALVAILSGIGGGESQPEAPPASGDSKVPPGQSAAYHSTADELAAAQKALSTPGTVRGTARVQLSTPALSFRPGSSSDVTVHVQIRAHYRPDAGTLPLPEPIHGEVRIAFSVGYRQFYGLRFLYLSLTEDDSQITFLPAVGTLGPSDANRIAEQIRLALRTRFEPTSHVLPSRFSGFKSLGSGSNGVLAVPVTLSGAAANIADVTTQFLDPSDHYAVAISKEYVESLLQELKSAVVGFTQTFDPDSWWQPTYHLEITGVTTSWEAGKINVIVTGNATTAHLVAPNFSFTLQQPIKLVVNAGGQSFSLGAAGPQTVVVAGAGVFTALVANMLNGVKLLDVAGAHISAAESQINAQLQAVSFSSALQSFDDAATSKFTSVDIQADGMILRGTLQTKARPGVVVQFTETGSGDEVSALKSWVPAGTVDRYVWSWQRSNPFFDVPHHHLEGTVLTAEQVQPHRFVTPTPDDLPPDGRLCLLVEGTQVGSGPGSKKVWGKQCQILWPKRIMGVALPGKLAAVIRFSSAFASGVPAWAETRMAVPVWHPDRSPDSAIDDAIVAHVSAIGAGDRRSPAPNAIVHFADAQAPRPLDILGRALAQCRKPDAPIAVILVLPSGSFQEARTVLSRRVGSLGERFSGAVAVTEDYDEGWTRMFAPEKTPATYLMNSRGELVWQAAGPLDAGRVAAALDEHLIAGAKPTAEPVRLTIKPGDRAPDFLSELAGDQAAIRKLRGRRVLLTFWQAWSAPCVRELRRLQSLHDQAARGGPVVVAVNDGGEPKAVAAFQREHNLTFTLVPDPFRYIARRYGVTCWPTTVSITEAGLVDGVQFGVTTDDRFGEPAPSAAS